MLLKWGKPDKKRWDVEQKIVDKYLGRGRRMRFNLWIYFVGFAIIFLGMFLIFGKVFGVEIEDGGLVMYLLLLFSFGIISFAHNVIEKKNYDITRILRRIATVVLYCIGISLFGFMGILYWLSYSFYEHIVELILFYIVSITIIIVLAFISSIINRTSFKLEWSKIISLEGFK